MNILKKYQLGGGFDSLFAIYLPSEVPDTRLQAASLYKRSKKDDDDDDDDDDDKSYKKKLTEKDLYMMLKDIDGLPNEIQALANNLITTLQAAKLTGMDELNDLGTMYISNLTKLKIAKYNKDWFKNAYDRAVENKSLSEPAIINGYIQVVSADGKLHSVKPEDLQKVRKSGKYLVATVGNILWMRSHMPEYQNRNDLYRIAESSIGIEEVHNRIKNKFLEIGNAKSSVDTVIPKEAVKGGELLAKMISLGPEGYYKYTEEMSTVNESQIDATLTYIYSTLDVNSRARLAMETRNGTQKLVKALIKSMILGTIDSETKNSVQFLGTEEKLSGSGDGSSDSGFSNSFKLNTALRWVAGYGTKEDITINLGTTTSFRAMVNTMPLVDTPGKNLGSNSTLQLVSEGQFNGVLDLRSATMGMKLIKPDAFNLIVLSDGKISSVDFLCINKDGVIIPDLSPENIRKKEKADAQIRLRGISLADKKSIQLNYTIINQIYLLNGLPPAYAPNGELLSSRWHRFGVINAKTSNGALGMDLFEGNSLLEEDVDDNSIQNYITTTKDEDWDDNNFLWNGKDHLYKGTIWIPVQVDYNAAASNMEMTPEDALRLDAMGLALSANKNLVLGRLLKQ